MNKLLVIGGPTVTGKTDLALKLAEQYPGDLISADSRQVYLGLDIVTGKDIPTNFKFFRDHYTDGHTNLYGLDLLKPDAEWNVALFQEYARTTIKYIWSKKRLPIIVGGTGLYLKSLLEPFSAPSGPPDHLFRDKLARLPLTNLQERAEKTIPDVFFQMNHSDQNNPRRLIRALEINFYSRFPSSRVEVGPRSGGGVLKSDILAICLTAPISYIEQKIATRVKKRLKTDLRAELQYLKSFPPVPASTTLGYRELDQYFSGALTQDQLVQLWTTKERQYAKRQLTWFKKQSQFQRFDITAPDFSQQIHNLVDNWYTDS